MKYMVPLFVLLLVAPYSRAQADTAKHPLMIFNWSPFSAIDVIDGPALRIGTEYYTAARWGLTADAKYYAYIPSNSGFPGKSSIRGYVITPGIKFYLKKMFHSKGKVEHPYLSLQYAYKDQAYSGIDSISANTSPFHISKKYRMHQYVNTFLLSYGHINYKIKSRFICDYYFGIGLRLIYGTSDLAAGEKVYDYHDWTTDMMVLPNTATGFSIYPTIALGMKLGLSYRIRQFRK